MRAGSGCTRLCWMRYCTAARWAAWFPAGAAVLRARLRPDAAGAGLSVAAADAAGALVISVSSLVLRPAAVQQPAMAGAGDALFTVEWVPVAARAAEGLAGVAVAGEDWLGLAGALAGAGGTPRQYPSITALAAAVAAGEPPPPGGLARAGGGGGGGGGGA